ncbi:actin cytoskeleton-regulatory complex protein pan1 isoform X8 [Nematostella vectensis]|uniref:actin cytoskeleton-regulatory complex protein pan1 isoform X8 n=1 Tax=Nematostella vectensis TaxID=45351 RepID=UPI002077176E|nr:actin cytoskeleton-regulatory complex protein pan1 isoform X8 [Nematostella vectensis]
MAGTSVKVDLGISHYKKSYEFKTDWYHQRPGSGFFKDLLADETAMDDKMRGEIDSVLGLLDRLKDEREKEFDSSQEARLNRLELLKEARKRAGEELRGDEDRAVFYPKKKGEEARVMDFSVKNQSGSSSEPLPRRPPVPVSYELPASYQRSVPVSTSSSTPVSSPSNSTPSTPIRKSSSVTVTLNRRISRESCGSGRESRDSIDASMNEEGVGQRDGRRRPSRESRGSGQESRDSIDSTMYPGGEVETSGAQEGGVGRVVVKRKQQDMVAEIHEKAEVISKSARKGPEAVSSSVSHARDIEDDPEVAEYLRRIRGVAVPSSGKAEPDKQKEDSRDKAIESVPTPKTVSVQLNLDLQKSRISAAKAAPTRRKPTADHRRSWRLSNDDTLDEKFAEWEKENIEDVEGRQDSQIEPEVSPMACSAVASHVMEASTREYPKPMLARRGSSDDVLPRTHPKAKKPAWKSKTYGGIALPAFDEAVKSGGTKKLRKTSTEAMLTADVVKQAALDKLNRAAKEDRPEREPEKPAWLVEAETRRKLHDRRRHAGPKVKPAEEPEPQGIPVQLRRTGAKLTEGQDVRKEEEDEEEPEEMEIAVKLRPTGRMMAKEVQREPEKVEFSFKLRPTGIQLVDKEDQDEDRGEESANAVIPVRLRPVGQRGTAKPRRDEPQEEPEIAVKLRLARERLDALDAKEEEKRRQEEHVHVPIRMERRYSTEKPKTEAASNLPVKRPSRGEIHAVTLSQKSMESAHVVSPMPTRTTAESTPPLTPTTRTPGKASYKDDGWARRDERYPAQERRAPAQDRREPAVDKRGPAIDRRGPAQDRGEPAQDRRQPAHDRREAYGRSRTEDYGASREKRESYGTRERKDSRGSSGERRELYSKPRRESLTITTARPYQTPTNAKAKPYQALSPSYQTQTNAKVKPFQASGPSYQAPSNVESKQSQPIPAMTSVYYTPPSSPESRSSSSGTRASQHVGERQVSPVRSYVMDTAPSWDSQVDGAPRDSRTRVTSPSRKPEMEPVRVTAHIDGSEPIRIEQEPPSRPARVALAEATPQGRSTPDQRKTPSRSAKIKARHLSSERSKTVTVTASEVPQVQSQRRASAEYPQFMIGQRTPEYPKMRVEKVGNGYLKHAAVSTVVKAKHIPSSEQKILVRTHRHEPDNQQLWRGDADVRQGEPQRTQEVEPQWMKDLSEKRRKGQGRRFSAEILSADEQCQPTLSRDDEVQKEVPGFLKEFEKKRRNKGPAPEVTQVIDRPIYLRIELPGQSPGYRRPGSSNQSYV